MVRVNNARTVSKQLTPYPTTVVRLLYRVEDHSCFCRLKSTAYGQEDTFRYLQQDCAHYAARVPNKLTCPCLLVNHYRNIDSGAP